MAERLQKFLARSGIGSRRDCEKLIKSKKVIVNGQIAEIGSSVNKNDIVAEVVNMHTIKPIDINKVNESAKKSKLIVSIEEHNIIGGLGSAIAECLVGIKNSPEQIFFGINDSYSEGGDYSFLKQKFNLTPDFISKKIISRFKEV